MYYTNNGFYGIKPENIFDLPCYDRKSFYGKAKVIECKEGRYLQSYNTIICFLSYGGDFQKLWNGYSVTTMRHINSFLKFVRWETINKKAWERLEEWETTEKRKSYRYEDIKNLH